jgi:hypothetical protein
MTKPKLVSDPAHPITLAYDVSIVLYEPTEAHSDGKLWGFGFVVDRLPKPSVLFGILCAPTTMAALHEVPVATDDYRPPDEHQLRHLGVALYDREEWPPPNSGGIYHLGWGRRGYESCGEITLIPRRVVTVPRSPMADPKIVIWFLQDLDMGRERWYVDAVEAYEAACRIVDNRSSTPFVDGWLFGPGDGSTRVMLRKFPIDLARHMGWKEPQE